MAEKEKKPPVHKLAIGRIEAAIWENADQNNGVRYAVTFSRRYMDGDEHKSTSSFRLEDLTAVERLARMAFNWIWMVRASSEGADEAEVEACHGSLGTIDRV
ncbi:MAG: hypothetical protein L0387_02980 [Acidobacteria bacterium]|nr:hypothetical protein [Acidobacteriota bacterium]MCI0724780.1 hypothetical protein [Acidobacteriota bacterium]